jgi:hypothetical protein
LFSGLTLSPSRRFAATMCGWDRSRAFSPAR